MVVLKSYPINTNNDFDPFKSEIKFSLKLKLLFWRNRGSGLKNSSKPRKGSGMQNHDYIPTYLTCHKV